MPTIFPSSGTFSNAMTFSNNINVVGTSTVSGASTIHGAATLNSTLGVLGTASISGATTINNTLGVLGATTISGSINIPTGAINGYVLTTDASGNATWKNNSGLYSTVTTTSGLGVSSTLLSYETLSGKATTITGNVAGHQSGDGTGGSYDITILNNNGSGAGTSIVGQNSILFATTSGSFSVGLNSQSGTYVNVSVIAPNTNSYLWRTSYIALIDTLV